MIKDRNGQLLPYIHTSQNLIVNLTIYLHSLLLPLQSDRFNAMAAPLTQLQSWYTTCTKEQQELHLCHGNDDSNHAQFFVDFSIFASTQFLPYYLTDYLQYYTLNGVDPKTMEDARNDLAKQITNDFAGKDGLYQVCPSPTFDVQSNMLPRGHLADHIFYINACMQSCFAHRRTTQCTTKQLITVSKQYGIATTRISGLSGAGAI